MLEARIIAMPEEAKKAIIELTAVLKATIENHIAQQTSSEVDFSPTITYLALDILRNETAQQIIAMIKKDNEQQPITAIPSFEKGIA